MPITVSQLVGARLTAAHTTVGTVSRVAFDVARGTVLGLLIVTPEGPRVVYQDAIRHLTAHTIALTGDHALQPIAPGSLADRAQQATHHVIDLPAITESGTTFGTVVDVILTEPVLTIHQMVVHNDQGERLLDHTQIKEITDQSVIFFDSVVRGHVNWHTHLKATDPTLA